MQSLTSRYGTALLPLAVLVLGVLDAAQKSGTNLVGWQTITQLVILVATTGAAFWLPLVPGKWSGALKTGAAIVGAIASALVATVPDGHFTQGTWILFLTAAIKAVAVQVGVSIRTDAAKVIDARETPDGEAPVVTSAPLATVVPVGDLPEASNLVAGDGLGGVTITSADDASAARAERAPEDGPDHRADTSGV